MSIAAPERLLLAGAAGDLELLIETPSAVPLRAVAVCCHPHPLFGGSLTNKVIHTVARAFVAQGAATVRFNFRGVGASAGVHDEGRGEFDDLRTIAAWARALSEAIACFVSFFASLPSPISCRISASIRINSGTSCAHC